MLLVGNIFLYIYHVVSYWGMKEGVMYCKILIYFTL